MFGARPIPVLSNLREQQRNDILPPVRPQLDDCRIYRKMDTPGKASDVLGADAPPPNLTFGWRFGLGLGISAVFLFLALRDVHWIEVLSILQKANVAILGLAVVSFLTTGVAKAARWRMLFALRKKPSLGRSFAMFWIGSAINTFGPARLGDLVRAYLIGEAEAESKVYALGTIGIEKMAELFFLMLALALLLSQMVLPDWLAGPARVTGWLIAMMLPLFMWLAWQNDRVGRWLGRLDQRIASAWGTWFLDRVRSGLQSLELFRRPALLGGLLAWSLIILFLGAWTNYIVFAAMGLVLSPWAALLLLVVLQVGVAVPSSPGRVGVFHYLVVITLAVFGVDKEVALGYSVVLYLVIYLPMALLGVYCLWYEKVTWRKLADAFAMLARLNPRVR